MCVCVSKVREDVGSELVRREREEGKLVWDKVMTDVGGEGSSVSVCTVRKEDLGLKW